MPFLIAFLKISQASGFYLFDSAISTAIQANTAYTIRIPLDGANQAILAGQGREPTLVTEGNNDAIDSNGALDSNNANRVLVPVQFGAPNSFVQTFDVGFVDPLPPSLIGNRVWLDVDGDGVQDAGEPGIQNVEVILFDPFNNLVQVTTTGADGYVPTFWTCFQ